MRRSLPALLLGGLLAHAAPAAGAVPSALSISVGLGIASPDDPDVEGRGSGGYAAAEYVLWPGNWLTPRAYGGLLLSSSDGDCGNGVSPCDVSARIGFVGGKVRLMAPIPYVGPFLELGLGASVGRISTRSGPLDVTGRGLMYHVPWSIGLAMGQMHQYELAFRYLQHPDQEQFSGAVAFGFTFGL